MFGNVDSYGDMVMPGAFTKTLNDLMQAGKKLPMLWQHDTTCPIGVFSSLEQDNHGLKVEGEINLEVEKGQECYSLMKQGAIDSMSIGYSTIQEQSMEVGEEMVNCLKEIKLWEGSMVTFPANAAALVESVKQAEVLIEQLKKLTGVGVAPEVSTQADPEVGPEPFHPEEYIASLKNLNWEN